MKKQNILNLIKYHVEKNDNAFRDESVNIAREFDSLGDYELAEYIMSLITQTAIYVPQANEFTSEFIKYMDTKNIEQLNLPISIADDVKGIINAVNHKVGINKFIFEGCPGSGKTEAAKYVAKLLDRYLYYVDFDNVIESLLGKTSKNISVLFDDINKLPYPDKSVILFDEIDSIALDRVNSNDVREMGRVTSSMLRELDKLSNSNSQIVLIATTNLYKNFDKALLRRFDATINFDRYSKEDLVEISENYLNMYIKNFKNVSKDTRLFKKILNKSEKLPYPGELKNIIKTSLAFSDVDFEYDYLRRLYNSLIGDLDKSSLNDLYDFGFTVREIEKLKGESKSKVSRQIIKNQSEANLNE